MCHLGIIIWAPFIINPPDLDTCCTRRSRLRRGFNWARRALGNPLRLGGRRVGPGRGVDILP